jgi:hypothetical protein
MLPAVEKQHSAFNNVAEITMYVLENLPIVGYSE